MVSADKYYLGRITVSILQEVLPEALLKASTDHVNGNERADTEHKDDGHKERRLCCICGPIPFMKEAKRYLKY